MKYYVCDYRTHRVLLGPWTSAQVVEFINNSSDPKLYCNMSRYMLAKEGVYPNNKAGDNLIALHIVSGPTKRAPDTGESAPSKHLSTLEVNSDLENDATPAQRR